MKILLQLLFKNLPSIVSITFLMFIQLLFIQVNIIGIFLFVKILLTRDIYKAIIIALFTSIIFDSVTVNPIGLWALSFYFSSLVIVIIARLLKINEDINTVSKISLVPIIILISLAASLQIYIITRLQGHQSFDFNHLYSIVALSTLYTLFIKITARPDRLALSNN